MAKETAKKAESTEDVVAKRVEESRKPMSDEEASKFADKQATASSDMSKAAKDFDKAVQAARKAGLDVVGNYSFMENNVSFNRPI